MATLIENGIPIFTDLDGKPLENGYIFIGEPGLNPLTNPLQAYWDEDLTKPAYNIRTKYGMPSNNGAAGRLFVPDTYSILVQNKKGETVYSLLESYAIVVEEGNISPNIPLYNAITTYSNPGVDVVSYAGYVFTNISNVANVGNNPLSNPDKWYKVPSFDDLLDSYFSGSVISGGFTPHNDRSSAKYLQNMHLGQYVPLSGGTFNVYKICLDGTQVTGNANLEAILGSYWNLDLIAPDSLGTRTLIDMSSRHVVPQSNGGDNDVLGGVLEDRFQGFQLQLRTRDNGGSDSGRLANSNGTNPSTLNNGAVTSFLNDGTNGTPRTGSTTRPKEFTVGSSYIIVMVAS